MTKNNSFRVVWLCHFTNKEIQDIIKPYKRVHENSPWIASLTKLFEGHKDIDLHIISPHEYMCFEKHFVLRGIHYHFFNPHIPFWGRHWPVIFKFDVWSNYFINKYKINNIVKRIAPDLIHLHGAENAYYSSGILSLIDKYPILLTIQGFVRNSSSKDLITKSRIKVEENIIKRVRHIGVRTGEMSSIVLEINPLAQLHFHNYSITIPSSIKEDQKKAKFDIVFFARITKDKGIEDLLMALVKVKLVKPDVKLCVIGSVGNYLLELQLLLQNLKLEENVTFLGFMETQQEVYKIAVNANICVLPTYHDIIPGTIIESMLMKLPVVAYAVGGIPELNSTNENILLVERFNIKQLSEKIIYLLQNEEIREELSERAYSFITQKFNNKDVITDILSAYHKILHPEIDKNARN